MTKLTDADMLEKFFGLLRAGVTIKSACAACDISRMSVSRWRNEGALKPKSKAGEFARKFDRALAESETIRVGLINKASQKDYRAATWWLERRMPEDYGDKMVVTHEMKQELTNELVERLRSVLDAETFAKVASAVLAAGDDSGPNDGGHEQ